MICFIHASAIATSTVLFAKQRATVTITSHLGGVDCSFAGRRSQIRSIRFARMSAVTVLVSWPVSLVEHVQNTSVYMSGMSHVDTMDRVQ
jgi:hypothetical protein